MDQDKLVKILMLSTSDADGEALNAIRMANAMLKSAKVNWREFLAGKGGPMPSWQVEEIKTLRARNQILQEMIEALQQSQTYKSADEFEPEQQESANIEDMIETCLDHVMGGARDFIESLEAAYTKWGRLTPKQFSALQKFYWNCKDK